MIRGVTLAALVATATAWSTSGCPNPPCMEDCWVKDSCSKCVADVNCGWCSVTKTCMEGVIMGPLSSNCSAWDYAFCSGEPCATYRTCSTCMTDPESLKAMVEALNLDLEKVQTDLLTYKNILSKMA